MVSSRNKLSSERRQPAEYVLIVVAVCLFLFGLWAYRAGNQSPATSVEPTVEPGTPAAIDALSEQDSDTEQSLESAMDKKEYAQSDDMEAAADALKGAYDESAY